LRILHIGKYYAPFKGGVETYLGDSLKALTAAGDTVSALVHDHETGTGGRTDTFGGDEGRWEVQRSATWTQAFFTPISPGFRSDLKTLIEGFKPDIIHAHLPNPSACWLLSLPQARKLPLVLHWHSDVLTDGIGAAMGALYRAYRPFERRLLDRAAAIIATSRSYLESSESLSAYPEKCHVVPLGLDETRVLAHAPEQPAQRNDRFQILAIGRLTYYKGFGFLIRALAELPQAELHIIGEGALHKELWKLAQALKVAGRVRFHGGVDDATLAAQLSACDCVCLPSIERTEAFGLVLLEAMAFGKPTVVSRVPGSGMSWVVEDGVTGLMAPPRDVGALAAALERLRSEPGLAQQLGDAGRQRFEQTFAIEPSVAALRTVYAAVAGKAQQP